MDEDNATEAQSRIIKALEADGQHDLANEIREQIRRQRQSR